MSIRPIKRIVQSQPTIEGAGVRLRRAFGFGDTKEFDPFLLFDDFRNENPEDYLAGFPWHPHRGIETITYVLAGTVEHGDSIGNRGAIAAGDIQWMTAGSGIIHQEMPKGDAGGRMHGFQLWANLPSALKMTAPRSGPTEDVGWWTDAKTPPPTKAENRSLVLFDRGDEVTVQAGDEGIRFLLVSGKPLQEPVAWYGPIVMNTQEQLREAFEELQRGTFLRTEPRG